MQSAADAAAYSAAIAYSIDNTADISTQAEAIVANYGFVVGTGNDQANVVATVDTTTYSPLTAIDVAVTRPQLPILSRIWVNNPFNVRGSAKAIISGGSGPGNCALALGKQQVRGGPITTDAPAAIEIKGGRRRKYKRARVRCVYQFHQRTPQLRPYQQGCFYPSSGKF